LLNTVHKREIYWYHLLKERKPTSFDIAYRAGVSQSTVSRALRNSPLVTPETRKKIQDIARELNYHVDKHAASLRSQHSRTLALLIFEDPTTDDSLINPFFLAMIGNITRAASSHGYDLLLCFQQLREDWQSEYEFSSRADGIILLGYGDYRSYQSKLDKLTEDEAHFVIWGPALQNRPGLYLGCDNARGGVLATEHLLQLGHRDIAFLGGADESCPELRDRYRGHSTTLTKAGIQPNGHIQIDAGNEEQDGYDAAQKLLDTREHFTALFCASDLIAIGGLRALQESGRQVPRDISVVGFDDIPAASYVTPALTTIHQDTCRSGQLLVESLIHLIAGEPVNSTLVTPNLVVRESSGPAPKQVSL